MRIYEMAVVAALVAAGLLFAQAVDEVQSDKIIVVVWKDAVGVRCNSYEWPGSTETHRLIKVQGGTIIKETSIKRDEIFTNQE